MKHLSVEQMIDFVSFNKINEETLALASIVNAHLMKCKECREKVEAFQLVYDEFLKMGKKIAFKESVLNNQNKEKNTVNNSIEIIDKSL